MLQQLVFEAVTEVGGLNRGQFQALLAQSALEAELARLTRAIETSPNSAAMYAARGDYLSRLGRWRESADDFQRAVKLNPVNRFSWMRAAPLLLLAGDHQAFEDLCRAMVEQFRGNHDPNVADAVCKVCVLRPGVVELSELPVQDVRDGAADPKWKSLQAWFKASCGLLSDREGNPEEAINWTGPREGSLSRAESLRLVVRAVAEQHLGRTEKARETLAQAESLMPAELRTLGTDDYTGPLPVQRSTVEHDWLIPEILRREAQSLLTATSPLR